MSVSSSWTPGATGPIAPASREAGALAAALAVIAVWGLNFPLQKAIFGQIGPVAFNGLRFLIVPVCAVLLLIWRYRLAWPTLDRSDWWPLVRLALVGQGLHLILAAQGMAGSTAFSASLLLACGPVFTLLILRAYGLERLVPVQLAGVAIAVAGVLFFTSDKLLSRDWHAGAGDLVLLLAASLFSWYTVASKPLIQRHGGVAVLAYGSLIATLPVLAFSGPTLIALPWAGIPAWVWWGTLWSVVGGGFIGWLAWGYANEHRGVARTAPLIYLMPVVAGFSAWLFAGEAFTWGKVAAALVVLAGVALAQFGKRWGEARDASVAPPA